MAEEIELTPEQIAEIQAQEDAALAEFVESNGKGYLTQVIQECDTQIADCNANLNNLQGRLSSLSSQRNKAQKALNALNRIAPSVLPMSKATGVSDVT